MKSSVTGKVSWFLGSSFVTVSVLSGILIISKFWVLFIACVILLVALYIGDSDKYPYRKSIKNGTFGGFWLLVPVYAYLFTST